MCTSAFFTLPSGFWRTELGRKGTKTCPGWGGLATCCTWLFFQTVFIGLEPFLGHTPPLDCDRLAMGTHSTLTVTLWDGAGPGDHSHEDLLYIAHSWIRKLPFWRKNMEWDCLALSEVKFLKLFYQSHFTPILINTSHPAHSEFPEESS